jgi:S1-C subfamily serine protease
MKTRITICATLFALALTATAVAEEQFQQFYVNPGVNPGCAQPRLEFNGHFHPGEGMCVEYVIFGGLAHRLGLEPGDMIVAINGQLIMSDPHYFQLLNDAVMFNGGHAQLLVRNVRGFPAYVTVDAYFPCAGAPPVLYNQIHP